MDTTTSVVLAVIITAVGEWSKPDGKLSVKLVIGMMVLALFLSAMESANADFAKKFAMLILVGAIFVNVIPITKKLGFTK